MNRMNWPAKLLIVLALIFCIAVPANAAGDLEGAKAAIAAGLKQNAAEINIQDYQLTEADIDTIYDQLFDNGKIPWNLENYRLTVDYTGRVVCFYAYYLDTDIYDPVLYEAAVQRVLDAAVFDGMQDWQIALSIHDYLVSHFQYDETYTRYTGYDLLVNGSAVCAGYTEAYMDLLGKMDIPTCYVSSEAMNHAWCQVQIDGEWYHVDPTWDDPIPDSAGSARHDFFLLSDAAISDQYHRHYNWKASHKSTNTRFDSGMFWENMDSPIIFLDADTMVVRRYDYYGSTNLYIRKESSGTETLLCSVEGEYVDIGFGGPVRFAVDGLSYWNEMLYFNDMQRVYCVSPSGGEVSVVYSYDANANQKIIYSTLVSDEQIQITTLEYLRQEQAYNYETFSVMLPDHIHKYSSKVTPVTCTTNGYTTYTCVCGYIYEADIITATGHWFMNYISDRNATITSDGTLTAKCEYCSATNTIVDEGSKLRHGWVAENGKWYYYNAGQMYKNRWVCTGGKWYYLSENGVMATGWTKVNGKWYYLNQSGVMQIGWVKVGNYWYYMGADGVMQTGWIKVGSYWYYMSAGGVMQTGWVKVGNNWYYMSAGGVMQTGWVGVGSNWYYMSAGGAMQTGWVKVGNYWYYMNTSGAMVTGTQVINGKTYKFNSNGVWIG